MNLIFCRELAYSPSATPLLEGLTFGVDAGDRVGLVGTNGCGKSTLLSLLAGDAAPDEGEIITKRGLRVRLVRQFLPEEARQQSALEMVSEEADLYRAEELLSRLGFDRVLMERESGKLSGGWVNRLLLAQAIAAEPDLLLLDEPTNHMDTGTILLFQQFMERLRTTFVVVSHDRALLDGITKRTVFVRGGKAHSFDVPYSQARHDLMKQEEDALERYAIEQKEIDRVQASMKRLATWAKVYDNEKFATRARSMGRRIEKLEATRQAKPWRDRRKLGVRTETPRASRLIDITDLTVSIPNGGKALFTIESLHVGRGDRIAVLGANGCGKSLLLGRIHEAIANEEHSAHIRINPQVTLGYYDQKLVEGLDPEASLLDTLARVSDAGLTRLRSELVRAGFANTEHQRKVGSLSGGERSRLQFLSLGLRAPSLLMLDEPTNHMDVEGCEALEAQLLDDSPTLLFVSHDRRFCENVATRFWVVCNDHVLEVGALDDWYAIAVEDAVVSDGEAGDDSSESVNVVDEEAILTTLLELEAKLEADLKRKARHQKPALQAQWRQEIKALYARLEG